MKSAEAGTIKVRRPLEGFFTSAAPSRFFSFSRRPGIEKESNSSSPPLTVVRLARKAPFQSLGTRRRYLESIIPTSSNGTRHQQDQQQQSTKQSLACSPRYTQTRTRLHTYTHPRGQTKHTSSPTSKWSFPPP